MKIIETKDFQAIFIFLSTIIGLGVFILPYVLKESGIFFWFWLLFWFVVFYILHLLFAEILLQTKEKHNLPGLAGLYLHPYLKHVVWFFDFWGMIGVFWVYLLALTKFWGTIFPDQNFAVKLIFVLFNIYFISKNLKIFANFETVLGSAIIIFFIIISLWFGLQGKISNLSLAFNLSPKEIFLPYGVLLFAFSGTSAVPLVLDLIEQDKKKFKKINFISLFLVSLIYVLFALSMLSFLGEKISEVTLDNLKPFIPFPLYLAILILITFNIMLVDLAFYLKRGLIYDYGLKEGWANLLLNLLIFLLVFLPESSLVKVISFISEIFLAFNLLIINLIYLKLKTKNYFLVPKTVVIFISLFLILGTIYGLFFQN